jgi:fructosamine-3-kinase
MVPIEVLDAIAEALGGRPGPAEPIRGGDASQAARVVVDGRPYLVKWRPPTPGTLPGWPAPFVAEANGLDLLAEAIELGGPRVPTVFAHGAEPAFIVLEWIEQAVSGNESRAGARLGEQLAALHRLTDDRYGLDHDNYCGLAPQANGRLTSWREFYARRRLEFQLRLARRGGRLTAQREDRLTRLIERLDQWIDDASCQPSLLHGDLWGGNWLIAADLAPVLIDPAAYYGHREAELALCHLFGGFPASFFAAYDAAWPPAAGRDDRIPLYQLYHLLNHLNLFGEAYGARVDAVLRRYVGPL